MYFYKTIVNQRTAFLKVEIYIPQYPLRYFVRSVIWYAGYSGDTGYEQLLPDGHAQLIITIDDSERVLMNAGTPETMGAAWFAGVQTEPVIYQSEQNASTLGIQFEAGGVAALTGIPASEFSNRMVDASAILRGSIVFEFREKLQSCIRPCDIFRVTDDFLTKNIIDQSDNAFLSFAVSKLCHENLSLPQVTGMTGYSQKHFIHLFKKKTGISPKKYQRLYRFNKALEMMQTSESLSYSDISFNCNFYDQAHFIRDFRSFSGFSPGEYVQHRRIYPHVIPLDSLR